MSERVFIVVRRDSSGEWLDLTSVSYHRDEASRQRGRREQDLQRHGSGQAWLKANPFHRIGCFEVTEVPC